MHEVTLPTCPPANLSRLIVVVGYSYGVKCSLDDVVP